MSDDDLPQQQPPPNSSTTTDHPCFKYPRLKIAKRRDSNRKRRNIQEEEDLVKALLKLARRATQPNIIVHNNNSNNATKISSDDDAKSTVELFKKVGDDVQVVQEPVPFSSSTSDHIRSLCNESVEKVGDVQVQEHVPSSSASPLIRSFSNKSFETGQVLGGNMSSHNSTKPLKKEKRSRPSTGDRNNLDQEHKCSDCGKIFATGQALGGHKRAHYDGGVGHPAAAKKSRKTTDLNNNFPAAAVDSFTNYFCDEEFNLQLLYCNRNQTSEVPLIRF